MLDLKMINGRSILNEPIEIGVKDKKIAVVSSYIEEDALEVIDVDNQYISFGWIDAHVHCYEKMSLYYDYPDEIGVKKGVTTVIDAGSSGQNNIREFYDLTRKSKTNVFALMNISKYGIVEQDELADLMKINQDKNYERIKELSDFIVGIKARMSKTVVGNNNVIPLEMAKELQSKFDKLPLMVHIGSAPPNLSEVLSLLDEGDIVTHCYNGKLNGILSGEGKIKSFVWEAYRRGIIFDVGHGTDSFNFEVAKEAIKEGLLCQSISTDIYHRNRENGPVHDLATTLEKMLALGISLAKAIEMVTINPANMFHLKNKGQLTVGMDADLTIFDLVEEEKKLTDSNGNEVIIQKRIKLTNCVVSGEIYEIGAK